MCHSCAKRLRPFDDLEVFTRFCLSFIHAILPKFYRQTSGHDGPFSTPERGSVSENTFIELTHTAMDFLAKSANILESAVDLNDSSSVDKFLASAHSHASVRALLHSFGLTLLWLLCFACSLASPLQLLLARSRPEILLRKHLRTSPR